MRTPTRMSRLLRSAHDVELGIGCSAGKDDAPAFDFQILPVGAEGAAIGMDHTGEARHVADAGAANYAEFAVEMGVQPTATHAEVVAQIDVDLDIGLNGRVGANVATRISRSGGGTR